MNPEHEASRTLVKSPPELWSELSDAESLARHMEPFGEIRITKLEPQTSVAWEGDRARGTVRLEPSGWGTKVILTAQLERVAAAVDAVAAPDREPPQAPDPETTNAPEPEPVQASSPSARRGGLLGKLLVLFRPPPAPPAPPAREPVAAPVAPVAPAAPAAPVVPAPEPELDPAAILASALERLGQAHHRPFSRA